MSISHKPDFFSGFLFAVARLATSSLFAFVRLAIVLRAFGAHAVDFWQVYVYNCDDLRHILSSLVLLLLYVQRITLSVRLFYCIHGYAVIGKKNNKKLLLVCDKSSCMGYYIFNFFIASSQSLSVGFLRKDGNLKQEQFSLKLRD